MTLVIEDGSGSNPLANSYATVDDCKAYCTARGFVLPADDAAIEPLLIRACDYLQSLDWKGEQTDAAQPLAWPRMDVFIRGSDTALADDIIPQDIIFAQCRLAYDTKTTDLLPTGSGREVIRQKVDVIETEYAQRNSGSVVPQPNAALAILTPYLENGGGFSLKSVRV